MSAHLSVDLLALEHASHVLLDVAGHLVEVPVASELSDSTAALPATDTAAACADLARRLGAGVLAHAAVLEATAHAVAEAARTYQATDARLAERAVVSEGRAA
jgi:hypothetical protein